MRSFPSTGLTQNEEVAFLLEFYFGFTLQAKSDRRKLIYLEVLNYLLGVADVSTGEVLLDFRWSHAEKVDHVQRILTQELEREATVERLEPLKLAIAWKGVAS